jgi:peptidoglycan/LPS O-acetylase OafA/YrhL
MMEKYRLTQGNSVILDLIRGLSAQLVVVGHGLSFFGIFTFLHPPNFPWIQNIAVLLFFILSGFLITYSTLKKKNYSFSQYFIDRFSRIYVAFIPAIIFVFLLDLLSITIRPENYVYADAFNIRTFIGNLLMLQDFPLLLKSPRDEFITSFGSARPFWTLAVEWWIYIFFGYIVLIFVKKEKIKFRDLITFAFLAIVPVYNIVSGRGSGLTAYWIFGSLICLLLMQNFAEKIPLRTKKIFFLLLIILAALRITITMTEYEAIFAFILALALLLILDITTNIQFSNKVIKLIKFNASYSYTLYLIHYSILSFLHSNFMHIVNPYLLFILGFLVSNILSLTLGYFTESIMTKRVKTFLHRLV